MHTAQAARMKRTNPVIGLVWLAIASMTVTSLPAFAVDYFDDFDRADNTQLGDGWIEKQAAAFSIAGGVATKNAVGSAYRDNIAYRPADEDLLDAEASVELLLQSAAVGYPQVLTRIQANTVAQPNQLDAYILYINNSATQAVLGRQNGSAFVNTLATLFLTTPLNTTDRFRLRLRTVGASPVTVEGWVERLNGADWEIIGQATASDNSANRIATPGAVGFGGYIESAYNYDNFNRLDLQGGGGDNPVPVSNGVTPSAIDEGSPGFSLTVQGSDFVPGAVVRWNGADRATGFVSANEVQATITAADVAAAGSASVTVFNPAPGGGESNPQTVTINALPGNPVPVTTGITPDTVLEASSSFTLVVDGAGFVPASVVRWNGTDRQTAYVNATQLQAVITAADVATAGTAAVTVFTPAPGGGLSNAQTFTITAPAINPLPAVAALSPDTALEGGSAFTLSVQGQDFIDGTVVRWNGSDRPTVFVSANELQATVDAADIALAGVADVSAFTPAPGGGPSTSLTFVIQASGGGGGNTQSLTSISPQSTVLGSGDVALTLNGSGFTASSEVRFGGIPVATTFVNADQLLATVDGSLLAVGLRSAVTVFTPEVDNQLSNAQTLFVLESGEQVFFDNFNRPDNPDLNNAWTEKSPSVFSLADGEIVGGRTPYEGFNHVITYRPAAEDAQNVEVGMEFVRTPGADSLYPQVHARVQRDTVTEPGLLTSYTLFFDSYNSPGEIHITPIQDWYECYIATWSMSVPFVEGDRYRLRFQVTGSNPVQLTGFMERLNVDYWEVVAAGTMLHDQNSQAVPGGFCNTNGMIPPITQAGSTGFAKWRDPSDSYDNFYTIRLSADTNAVPTTSSLAPNSMLLGSPAFTLTVNGAGFVPGAVVRWNGSDRPSTLVSSTEIEASISAADVAAEGTAQVTVFNPAPGGGLSNAQTFTIVAPVGNPTPALTALTPDLLVVDSAGFTLVVDGANFVPGAVVRWNGADRATSYVSATQVQAAIDASDVAVAGTATVTVFNPAPGGGVSNDLPVTILDPGTDFFDDFGRPDDADVGNGWIEKQPGAFSLGGSTVVKNAISTGYRDNLVYRPAGEDLLDVEVSVELEFQSTNVGYPQLFARLQSGGVGTANAADGYMLYVSNSTTQAILGRQRGTGFVETLATLFMTSPFNTTDRYRLRMRTVGSNPVTLDAYVERLGVTGWEVIGQASASDGSANRIGTAGSVGFGGYVEDTYTYDNFSRLFQLP